MKISVYTAVKISKNAWRIDTHERQGTIIYNTRRAAIESVEDYQQQAFNGSRAYLIRDTAGRILSRHGYGL